MPTRFRVIVAVALSCGLLPIAALPAQAEPAASPSSTGDDYPVSPTGEGGVPAGSGGQDGAGPTVLDDGNSTTVAYTLDSSTGGPSPAALLCTLEADSYKSSPYAKGSGDSECNAQAFKLTTFTTLQRLRTFGQWQFLDNDDSTVYNLRSVRSVSQWYCLGAGTYTYRVLADGNIEGYDGRTYLAYAQDQTRYTC